LAQKNPRIIPIHHTVNHTLSADSSQPFLIDLSEIFDKYDTGIYANLDADDEYAPDFLEKSLAFMEKHKLDIVACGNDFVDARTGARTGVRVLSESVILEKNAFNERLPTYYQFMRTVWGKLYSLSVLRKCSFENAKRLSYGADTAFVFEALRNAERVGILAESLHKYYVSTGSVSYKWDKNRIASDNILFDTARDFLISKAGYVSPINNEFLLAVYMNALKDTLKVLLGAELPQTEKLSLLREMFLCEHARTLAVYERFGARFSVEAQWSGQRRELFGSAAQWLLSREEVADEQVEGYCELGEFLSAAAENSGGWIFFKKLLARFLVDQGRLDEAKPKLDELAELLPEDEEVAELRAAARA
jgi:hypothetical protein